MLGRSSVRQWRTAFPKQFRFGSSRPDLPQPPNSFLGWYSKQLDTNPIVTKCTTSGLIAGAGDYICQVVIRNENEWDKARTARFTFLGTTLVGFILPVWYGWLARTIPGMSFAQVSTRVAMDQLLFAPAFLSLWLTSLWTLDESYQPHEFQNQLSRQLPSIVAANWALWVPAQLVNFRFTPVKYQLLFSNFVALAWNCFLSYTQSD